MATKSLTFTVDGAGQIEITDELGGVREFGPESGGPDSDNAVVRAVRAEFQANATTSGSVTVTAS